MIEKKYIRGNTELLSTTCKQCNKYIEKNSDKQIVYFCSKECRKQHKKGK